MTWEHYTIIALWVLGACACAATIGARKPMSISLIAALCFCAIWPGIVIFAVVAGLWERFFMPPWARGFNELNGKE